jgi:GNAT superfamily N-acetyltransferase
MIIRQITQKDYPQMAYIFNSIYPYYSYTKEDIRFEYEKEAKRTNLKAYVVEINGEAVAIAEYYKSWYKTTDNRNIIGLGIYVDSRYQGKGIGSYADEFILKEIRKENVKSVVTHVLNSHINSINFLIKRGFYEIYSYYELELDLEKISIENLHNQCKTFENIEVISLKEEKELDKLKLYELIKTIYHDMPSPLLYDFPDFKEWQESFFNNPYAIFDSFFIAKKGNEYIGFSSLNKENDEIANQGITGVIKDYRDKGIAKALKLKVIEHAKQKGFKIIRTWNGCSNYKILTLNRKLGFEFKRSWILFYKELD